MATLTIKTLNYNKLINYSLVGYALSLATSKVGVNFFEILILLFWILQGNWKEKYILYKNNLLIVTLILFLIFNILSLPWASSTTYALDYIAKYRHFLVILPIYSSLDKKFIKYIFSAFFLGILVSVLMSYGIFFELIHYKNIPPQYPSPFMNHTDYSIFLAFASILLLSRVLDKSCIDIKIRLGYILFFIIVSANLFINGGRTGQVTFIVIIFLKFILHMEHKLKATLISLLLIASFLSIAYSVSPNFQYRSHVLIKDIEHMVYKDDFVKGALGQRVAIWTVGFYSFKDNFILGHGIGNEMKELEYYAKQKGFNSDLIATFPDTHNTFLNIGLQLGILGLLSIISIFYSLFKLKFQTEEYKIQSLIFIVTYLLWSWGGHTFHLMSSMIFFTLFAGLFNAISNIETRKIAKKD